MAFRTEPGKHLIRQSPVSFIDENGDIIGTTDFLKVGLAINWERPEVQSFKARLRTGKSDDEIQAIYKLFNSKDIQALRCPQLRSYFIIGPLVKEYQRLSLELRICREAMKIKTQQYDTYPEPFLPSKKRFDELALVFDHLVAFYFYLDEIDVRSKPENVHYLFIQKEPMKN